MQRALVQRVTGQSTDNQAIAWFIGFSVCPSVRKGELHLNGARYDYGAYRSRLALWVEISNGITLCPLWLP